MPLFRKVLTVNGRPQSSPEGPGTIQRRSRLFTECGRRLAADPLASGNAFGVPVGDGCGLESLVARISPLFQAERSLIRWVALRGAFTELYIHVFDPTSSQASPEALEKAMGLEWVTDASGQDHPEVAAAWRSRLSREQCANVLGVASSVLTRVADYPRYSALGTDDIIADPRFAGFGDAVALDCIAWSAIALLRLGISQRLFELVPEPDALPKPGWYPEPLFAKAERYWDGSDWAAACRLKDGREGNSPLR